MTTSAPARPAVGSPRVARIAAGGVRRLPGTLVLAVLVLSTAALVVFGIGYGAYRIPALDVLRILGANAGLDTGMLDTRQVAVLNSIRLPRVILAVVTGAGLAVSGALMQGLFRNPLADPTLIGVSSGGAFAAAFVIVLGATWLPGVSKMLGPWTLPLAAFLGALVITLVVYRIGAAGGFLSLPSVLLAGIALNALAMAGVGFLSYLANDEQLRNLTFWNFGSLGGATWTMLAAVAPLALTATVAGIFLARPLNALALGESQASHLGVNVVLVKRTAIVLTALAVGSLVAATGLIGFIGLVAPHAIRLACGPDHRIVLPGAALLGAALMVIADALSRTVVAPADLPIGVLTAALGAPFFLALLLRRRGQIGL